MISIRLKINNVFPEITKLRILPSISPLIIRDSENLILKNLRQILQLVHVASSFLLFSFDIGELDVISELFHHLYKRIVHDLLLLLNQPVHIGRRGSGLHGQFRLRDLLFHAFYFDIYFNVISRPPYLLSRDRRTTVSGVTFSSGKPGA